MFLRGFYEPLSVFNEDSLAPRLVALCNLICSMEFQIAIDHSRLDSGVLYADFMESIESPVDAILNTMSSIQIPPVDIPANLYNEVFSFPDLFKRRSTSFTGIVVTQESFRDELLKRHRKRIKELGRKPCTRVIWSILSESTQQPLVERPRKSSTTTVEEKLLHLASEFSSRSLNFDLDDIFSIDSLRRKLRSSRAGSFDFFVQNLKDSGAISADMAFSMSSSRKLTIVAEDECDAHSDVKARTEEVDELLDIVSREDPSPVSRRDSLPERLSSVSFESHSLAKSDSFKASQFSSAFLTPTTDDPMGGAEIGIDSPVSDSFCAGVPGNSSSSYLTKKPRLEPEKEHRKSAPVSIELKKPIELFPEDEDEDADEDADVSESMSESPSERSRFTTEERVAGIGQAIGLILICKKKVPSKSVFDSQKSICAGCASILSIKKLMQESYRYCWYTGQVYCLKCHLNSQFVIPARMLAKDDIKTYHVHEHAYQFLRAMFQAPILPIRDLKFKSKGFARLKEMCLRLFYMQKYLAPCPLEGPKLLEALQTKAYLCSNEFVSLEDVFNCTGQSAAYKQLQSLMERMHVHITRTCVPCRSMSFICAICSDKSYPIFPFQTETTFSCPKCESIYHQDCFKASGCIKCKIMRRSRHVV